MSGLELLKTTYGDLPRDIRCLATSQITRWHDIRKLFAVYADSPKLEELYQCILKIDPDDDIVNPNYWLNLETLTRFKNVEVVNNPLYIPKEINMADYFEQFSLMLEHLPKLRQLTMIVDVKNLKINTTDPVLDLDTELYDSLLINIIDLFFQSVIRRSQGRLTILINHQLISLIDTQHPETAINQGQLTYEDKLYFLRHNHLCWHLDRGQNKYLGDISISPSGQLIPVFQNFSLPTIVSEDEPLTFDEIQIFIPTVQLNNYITNFLINYTSTVNNVKNNLTLINSVTPIKKLVVNYFSLLSQQYIIEISYRDNIIHYLKSTPGLQTIVSSNPPFFSRFNKKNFDQISDFMLTVADLLLIYLSYHNEIYPSLTQFHHVISPQGINNILQVFPNLQSIYLANLSYTILETGLTNTLNLYINAIVILLDHPGFQSVTLILTDSELASGIVSYFNDSRVKIHLIS